MQHYISWSSFLHKTRSNLRRVNEKKYMFLFLEEALELGQPACITHIKCIVFVWLRASLMSPPKPCQQADKIFLFTQIHSLDFL